MTTSAQALAISFLLMLLPIGCSVQVDDPPPLAPAAGGEVELEDDGAPPVEDNSCAQEGAMRECRVELPRSAGHDNCFVGVEYCIDGEWSACGEEQEDEEEQEEEERDD